MTDEIHFSASEDDNDLLWQIDLDVMWGAWLAARGNDNIPTHCVPQHRRHEVNESIARNLQHQSLKSPHGHHGVPAVNAINNAWIEFQIFQTLLNAAHVIALHVVSDNSILSKTGDGGIDSTLTGSERGRCGGGGNCRT